MTLKSLPLDDLEDHYCNRNCISCSVFFLARRFYCEKNLLNLRPIFALLIYDCSCLYRLKDGETTVCHRATCVILALIVVYDSSVALA